MKLEGKVALITGGGKGIGAAIAERFVKEGAIICINDLQQDFLDKVAQSYPAEKVTTSAGDVSKEEDVKRMVQTTIDFGGRLDVLVNNAAIVAQGSVADLDPKDWHQVLNVNLTGPFLLMRESIPHMIKVGGGSIINISSVGGTRCLPGDAAYATSKAGLIMLTNQAALDYGPLNIRCNAVCPGGVKTDMTRVEFGQFAKMIGVDTDAFFDIISEELPLRRFAEPHEMGGVCTFLASDDSSFMTGSSIIIDAGTSIVDVVGATIMGSLRRSGVEI